MAGDLDAAWALHQRISPDRWCITRRELHLFVAEVRRRWAQGAVPNGAPNGHGLAAWHNEAHEDAEHGPDLYQVGKKWMEELNKNWRCWRYMGFLWKVDGK